MEDHRSIFFQVLPFFDSTIDFGKYGGATPYKMLVHKKNKSTKSTRNFEDIPDSYERLDAKDLLQEMFMIAKGNFKPDWVEYLTKETGSIPNLELVNEKENRTFSLAEIERVKQVLKNVDFSTVDIQSCLLYTSPSPRDRTRSRMPSSA